MTAVLYPARIWPGDGVYYVQFLDLENGFTFGDTLDQAKEMAADVLSALLASYIEHGETIPEPVVRKGKDIYLIAPDAKVQAALLLRSVRGNRPRSEVAQAMGTTWQAYQKIEQPTSNTTLNKLQKAAKALGVEVVLELRRADPVAYRERVIAAVIPKESRVPAAKKGRALASRGSGKKSATRLGKTAKAV